MKVTRILVAGLAIATLGFSAQAGAQEWGPPPPPPHWGALQYGGYEGGRGWRDAGYGYRPYRPYRPHYRCWTEYRGWERLRVCR